MIAGPVQRALLAAGDAGADEVQARARAAPPRGGGCRRSARCRRRRRCRPRRAAATSSSITASVGRAGLDHDDRPRGAARSEATKSVERLARRRSALVAVLLDQAAGALRGDAVVHRDRVAVPGEVAGQVAAHHRQAGHADLCRRLLSHAYRHLSSHHYQRLETYRDVSRYGPVTGVRVTARDVDVAAGGAGLSTVGGEPRAGKRVVIPGPARQPSARRASIRAIFPVSASVDPGPDVGLEHHTHPGRPRGDNVDRPLHHRHHLVPLALDRGEHGIGPVGQAGRTDHPHRLGDQVTHGVVTRRAG